MWCHWLVQTSKEHYTAGRRGSGEWLEGVVRRATPSPEAQGLLEKIPSSLESTAEKGDSEDSSQAKTCSEGSTQSS